MYATQSPYALLAEIALTIGSSDGYASFEPPGMMLGPQSAPSSPPLTPIPM